MIGNEAQRALNGNKGKLQQAVYLPWAGCVPVLGFRANLDQEGELCPPVRTIRVWAKATLTSQTQANTWELWDAKMVCGIAYLRITSGEITVPIQNRNEGSVL